MLQQQYCLRWKYHHSNLQTMFSSLLDRGCFCDVTLACEEKTIRAHRVVLCACSVYFDSILTNHANEKNPIIIMKDAKFNDIKCLVEFMYKGEINVEYENLASLLKTAEELKIKGLAEVSWRNEKTGETSVDPTGPPVTAEVFDSRSLPRSNNSNVYVKTFNNPSSTSANSPNLLMYPKINTPVSLAPSEQQQQQQMHMGSQQPMQMSPFHPHPMVMMPMHMSQMQAQMQHQQMQQQMMSSPNIPQLTPLRIQGGMTEQASPAPAKKKRGRPPLDGEFEQYTSQMIVSNVQGNVDPLFTESSEPTPNSSLEQNMTEVPPEAPVEDLTEEEPVHDFLDIVKIEQPDTPEVSDYQEYDSDNNTTSQMPKKKKQRTNDESYVEGAEEEDSQSVVSEGKQVGNSSVILTAQELAEWSDVVKMSEYLTNGRRPQFWEEPFTRRVLDAIKNKSLEMKKAAEVLGVSYGTLYGRYREVYGCLKHPYRGPFPKNMLNWSQQQAHSESDLMNILHQGAMTMTGRPHKNSAGKQDMMSAHGYSEYQMGHQDLQQQLRSQGVTLISE